MFRFTESFDLAESVFACKEANFGVEVVTPPSRARAESPLFGIVGRANLKRVLIAGEARRLGARDEAVHQPVLSEPDAGIDRVAAVVVTIAGKVAGRLAVHEDRADG